MEVIEVYGTTFTGKNLAWLTQEILSQRIHEETGILIEGKLGMSGINKVIIVGNCGQDPETKALTGGGSVTNVSSLHPNRWKDKNSGEKQKRIEWHRIAY